MRFDWLSFLERHGIEYVTSGPNVGRGELGIRCPFCGTADPSQHMSISPEGRGWLCRRNRTEHRGKSPVPLIRALIGCSHQEAQRIVGEPLLLGTDSVLSQVEALLGGAELDPPPTVALREPREFRKFEGKPSARPYAHYMGGRGFPEKFLRRASAEMGLRYCTLGPFAGRVVFLVCQEGRLVNWTGRAISARARLRYRALSPDPEVAAEHGLPPAALSIDRCLLWFDDLLAQGGSLLEVGVNADTIYLCEGPFDSLKINMLGRRHGIVSTCFFTSSFSTGQGNLLYKLLPRFKNKYLLLDQGTLPIMLGVVNKLASLGVVAKFLPSNLKDPGELSSESELLSL